MNRQLAALAVLALGVACAPAQADDTPIADAVAQPQQSPPDNLDNPDNYAAFADVLARHQAMNQRVARISHRLRVANAPLCTVTRPDAGLSSHTLNDYPTPLRPLAMHFMALKEEGRFVRSVVPGSPADLADIEVGDEIISGWPVSETRYFITDDGPIRMALDTACVAPAFVINSTTPNAYTNGRDIELSTALIEQIEDDAGLALIIAHEMAHVLRRHRPDGPRWKAELQADADALTLMRNAGYDVAATVAGWEASVEAHRESQYLSATHPPVEVRLRNLVTALSILESGPDGFQSLPDGMDSANTP